MEITEVWTPYDIAQALKQNMELFNRGEIDPFVWDGEQRRLWNIAAEKHVMATVQRLVAPGVFR